MTGRNVVVAVIDTGVDPNHPVLSGVLVPGYDFTRNASGGSEMSDVNQSTMAILDGNPGFVNQSTMAILDQSTMAILDGPEYAAFGHGTMVAGAVHLVAPRAKIMPLKAFNANGSGYASDVLRAIYYAVKEGAKVLNMSFSFATSSPELQRALDNASSKGLIGIASAGNNGQKITVYPAGLSTVVGVASTTNYDTLSDFTNFGPAVAWIAAPGEGVVTTYPFGKYAAAWGTSFSAPLASGTAALLAEMSSSVNGKQTHDAEGQAFWISAEVSKGRLDIPAALKSWRRTALGY
jgi:subtilisin family serine protease